MAVSDHGCCDDTRRSLSPTDFFYLSFDFCHERKMERGVAQTITDCKPDVSSKRGLDSTDAPGAPTKRVKTAFAKHSRFWALDGNVILQFGAVAFKVHRSRLITQSVWFEKLFAKRAGREEPLEKDEKNINDVVVEVLDGVDVYHLDVIGTMEDFQALLAAMEDAM